jgi:hypothetical protein
MCGWSEGKVKESREKSKNSQLRADASEISRRHAPTNAEKKSDNLESNGPEWRPWR